MKKFLARVKPRAIKALKLAMLPFLAVVYLILLVPTKIAIAITGLISPVCRRQHGALCTPIITLKHPVSGKLVTLIGTLHLAEARYFQALRDIVATGEKLGMPVLFEQVRPYPPGFLAPPLAEDAQAKTEQMRELAKVMRLMTASVKPFGLTYQLEADGLPPQDHWRNTDMSTEELANRLAEENADLPTLSDEQKAMLEQSEPLILMHFYDMGMRHMPFIHYLSHLSPVRDAFKEVIVEERNDIAVASILQALSGEKNHVLAIWGAGHAPGICRDLATAGYRVVDRQWVPAYSFISKYRFIRMAVAKLLEERRAAKAAAAAKKSG